MEKRRAFLLMMLACFTMTMLVPGVAWAEDGVLPGEPIDSPFYKKYPPDSYIIDFVPKEDADLTDIEYHTIRAWNSFLEMVFSFYVWLCEFGIRLVNISFDPTTTNQMLGVVEEVLPSIERSVWNPLWFAVAALGFLACVIWWGMGETKRAALSVGSIILLIGLVPVLFAVIPEAMKQVNNVATVISGKVVSELAGVEKSKTKSVVIQEPTEAQQMQDQLRGRGVQWFYSKDLESTVQQTKEVKQAINQIDDALMKAFVYEPYLIANFGNRELGEKHFKELMKYGTDIEKRRQYLIEKGGINPQSGTAKNEDFEVFTWEGWKERTKNVLSAVFFAGVPLIAQIAFALLPMYMRFMAIAFAVLSVFFFLLSLWPSYGLREAAHHLYRVFSYLLMVVFYSIVLGIFLRIWIALQNPDKFSHLNLGGRVIVIAMLFLAFWTVMLYVKHKMMNIRGLSGRPIDMGVDDTKLTGSLNQAKWLVLVQGRNQWKKEVLAAQKVSEKFGEKVGENVKKAAIAANNKRKSLFRRQAELKNTLSKDANQVFQDMLKRNLDPTKESDRQKYIHTQPEKTGAVMEIKDWLDRPVDEQFNLPDLSTGKIAPPRPPQIGTPEYVAWQRSPELQRYWDLYRKTEQELHKREFQKYLKQREEYENSIWIARKFRRPPRFTPPSESRVLMEYRKRLLQKQMKNDGSDHPLKRA